MMRIFVGALLAAAINGPVDAQQRNRATGPVIFYAAPNGSDIDNDCLSATNPCTPQGAHAVATNNWDFGNQPCLISCSHRSPEGNLSVFVGRHGTMKLEGKVRCSMWAK